MDDSNNFLGTGESQKALEAFYRKNVPSLWEFAYPYRFGDSEKWHNPVEMACLHLTSVAHAIKNFRTLGADKADDGTSTMTSYAGFSLLPSPPPTYFVAPELLAAAEHTLPPKGIAWEEVNLPHEAMIMMLPRNNEIFDPSGNNLKGFLFFRITSRVEIIHQKAQLPEGFPPIRFGIGGVGIVGLAGANHYTSAFTYDEHPTTDACHLSREQLIRSDEELITEVDNLREKNLLDNEIAIFPEQHRLFSAEIMKLAVNLVFVLTARPELVKILPGKTRPAKNGKAAIVRPPVLGLNYKIQGGSENVSAGERDGNRSKLRLHWRRGHYRDQPFGKGKNQRKIIWIEPCIVGAD